MGNSIFQTLLNRLTDLSTRNKSIYLPKLQGNGFLDLQDLDFLNGKPSFDLLKSIISGKKRISLIPELDARIGEVNELSKQLSRLAFRDQLTQEETGDRSLFVGWPFVEGKLLNGHVLRAPLLLWPCQLDRKASEWKLMLDGSVQWNSAFLLAYSHGFGVSLDTEKLEEGLESLPADSLEFRLGLKELLERYFTLKINSGLFEDRILSFPNSQISIDSVKFQDGKLELKSYGVLGQFAQKSSFLFTDYETLLSDSNPDSLESFWESEFQISNTASKTREDQMYSVFPVDSSQEQVLTKVKEGRSLVVEGPPGTGKSQLISNLVSDFTARGKKVLVVSQKRAALDVVYERLEQLGMGIFLGLVHDFRGDQKDLFQKLKNQIDSIDRFQEENRALDSMQLEREVSVLSSKISRLSEKFENLRSALFELDTAGIPIKAMYLKAKPEGEKLEEVKAELLFLKFDEAKEFEEKLQIFYAYQGVFNSGFWSHRQSFATYDMDQYAKIKGLIHEMENLASSTLGLDHFQNQILDGREVSSDLRKLVEKIKGFEQVSLLQEILTTPVKRPKAREIQEWLDKNYITVQNLQFSVPNDLKSISEEIHSAKKSLQSWWGRLSFSYRKRKFYNLSEWINQAGLKWNEEGLALAEEAFNEFSRIESEATELPKLSGLDFSTIDLKSPNQFLSGALKVLEHWKGLGLDEYFDPILLRNDPSVISHNLDGLLSEVKAFENQVNVCRIYFTNQQIRLLLEEKLKISNPNLIQTLTELTTFDQFLVELELSDKKLMNHLFSQFGVDQLKEAKMAFWNSWYLCWIGELEKRNPILVEAGSLKLKQEMAELNKAILEKRKISQHITLLRLKEGVSKGLEFNRLGNRITYRDLLHQVGKKRQKWPIRKLVEHFGQEIFQLLPCWLASPETVSALFPIGQKFDLVIFDEASQCRVERGLPAMLRGLQVVIAGDSKQLKPSDFYQVKWENDEEGVDHEAESLLELAGNYFEKVTLKGHYRSADPVLIQFSNQQFYGGKLETLPDYHVLQAERKPFTWEKVEGIWDNQRNVMEAESVIQRVKWIKEEFKDDSIGIVTGNYFQMELIRERLWEEGLSQSGIKVRNIENVQGDEFDQVILSLGYAPNREGKLVTNFGLLGKSGGENRLNVAISRSRMRMHVISSIDPADFRMSHLKNSGLRLFQEFLIYAKSQAQSPSLQQIESIGPKFEAGWSLKNLLEKNDSRFSKQTPSSVMDLVIDLKGVAGAILTDDERFFDASSAKAAMAYHPILLEVKGWEWDWIWSREFFLNGQNSSF